MSEISAPIGAIVRVWFPESETVMLPGPKFRPVLVLDVATNASGAKQALVAYGTSQNTQRRHLGEFTVHSGECGLDRDTKFCLSKAIWLPLNSQYFCGALGQPLPCQLSNGLMPAFIRAAKEAKLL